MSTLDPPIDISFERRRRRWRCFAAPRSVQCCRSAHERARTGQQARHRGRRPAFRRRQGDRPPGVDPFLRARLPVLGRRAGPRTLTLRRSATSCNCSSTTTSSPSSTCQRSSAALGYPIDAMLCRRRSSCAALTLRVVLPVQPHADRDIGPPATSLHLEMAPPPVPKVYGRPRPCRQGMRPSARCPRRSGRRCVAASLIGRQQHAAALAEEATPEEAPKKGT